MKMISNNVLCRPDLKNYNSVKLGDIRLEIDTQFDVNKHSCVSGEVVAVPDKIKYSWTKDGKEVVEFRSPEIQIGDTVLWHFHDYPAAIKQGKIVKGETYESEKMVAIDYRNMFLAIRNGEIVAMNGTIVVEAIVENLTAAGLDIPEYLKNNPSQERGIVRYASRPIENENAYSEIKPGVNVFFRKYNAVPLQYDMHQIVDKGKTLYRMEHHHIEAYHG